VQIVCVCVCACVCVCVCVCVYTYWQHYEVVQIIYETSF